MSSTGVGFQVPYQAITLHAIARPESGPSIYCQLDELAGEPATADSPENDEAADMRELTIIPSNHASRKFSEYQSALQMLIAANHSVELIFEAMSLCASLHPDPNVSEDDDLDEAFVDESAFETFTGEEGEELSEVGRVRSDFVSNSRYAPY
jgi:chloride channel, nucleotide-sensitive, 1A